MKDLKLERLLAAAAQAREEDDAIEAPFGFDTRVVALWRANPANGNGLARLVRRTAMIASIVIVLATAATLREFKQSAQTGEPYATGYAVADSAIQEEMLP
jgi:hypothetical protein